MNIGLCKKDEYSNSDTFVGAGLNPDAAGGRDAHAVFAELFAPVAPGVELSVAGRYEDFGDGVSSFNPKVGLLVEPMRNLLLRGTYSTGFRAPSLNQLLAVQVSGTTIIDEFGEAATVRNIFVGSTDIDPEKSRNINVGFEYNWNGIHIAADYWNFKFEDIIGTISAQEFFDQNPMSPRIERDINGVPFKITQPLTNLSAIKTDGIDMYFSYTRELGSWGELDIDTATTWVNKYDLQDKPGSPVIHAVGLRQFNSNFAAPMPRWRGNYRVGVRFGADLANYVAFTGHYVGNVDDPSRPTPREAFFPIDFIFTKRLDAWGTDTVLKFGVNNIFDEPPPPITNDLTTFDDRLYDPLGRQFVLGFSTAF